MHTTAFTLIIICFSGALSHLFIYLLAYLFVYSLFVGLTFFLFASLVPRGERENIHLLMRAVINSEQAHPSLPSSVTPSLSLCPSDELPRSLSLPISPNFCHCLSLCVSLSLLCVFQSLQFSVNVSFLLSFPAFTRKSFSLCIEDYILSGLVMKMLFTSEKRSTFE